MHTTFEAVYDPNTGLQFMEPVQFDKPVHVLVTIVDQSSVEKQHDLLQQLTSLHEIPYVAHRSDAEIDNEILKKSRELGLTYSLVYDERLKKVEPNLAVNILAPVN